MAKRKDDSVRDKALSDNEEYISREDIDIQIFKDDDEEDVYVKFSGFDNNEEAEAYAEFLAETLPLLLFGTTRLH